jgi:hypothetical protein
LPTPTSNGEKLSATPTPGMARHYELKRANILEWVAYQMWPTPTAQDASNDGGPSQYKRNSLPLNAAAKMWPTPTAITNSGGAALCKWGGSASREKLRGMVSPEELNGQLNPTWVEGLMGLPPGWTEVE